MLTEKSSRTKTFRFVLDLTLPLNQAAEIVLPETNEKKEKPLTTSDSVYNYSCTDCIRYCHSIHLKQDNMTELSDEQQHIDNDEISLKELIQKINEWIAYLKTQWKIIIGIAVIRRHNWVCIC